MTILLSFTVYLLTSLGPTLVVMIGSLDLSYAGVLTLTGVLVAVLLPVIGLLALPVGLLAGVLTGMTNGLIVARVKIPSFLVTVGTMFITFGLADWITHGAPIPLTILPLDFLLAPVTFLPTLFLWAIGMTAICFYLVRYTNLGLNIYATGSSQHGARLCGINIERVRVVTFMLSGLLAAATGILMLPYVGAAGSWVGRSLIFIPLAAVLMGGTRLSGGVGGPHRTILGCYIIAVVLNGLSLLRLDPNSITIFVGLTIIIAMTSVSRQSLAM
jgi:ribose transport system permease protein/putative xylitol transport system permease protein